MALLNRCRRSIRSAGFKAVLAFLVFTSSVWIMRTVYTSVFVYLYEDRYCPEGWLNHYVHQMCTNYSSRLIFGSFCEDMCYDADIIVNSCMLHHEETRVIDLSINGRPMVLKYKPPKSDVNEEVMQQLDEIWQHWLREHEFPIHLLKQFILDHFGSYLGHEDDLISPKRKQRIVDSILATETERLSEEQLKSVYLIVRTEGSLAMIYYQDLKHVANYYGHCGQLHSVERLTPLSSFFPSFAPSLSWTKRAVIAVSLLDYMSELQTADDGPLHICDIKEADFGITSNYQVKSIDVDMLFTDKRTREILMQPNCRSDKDCSFFDCKSECNTKLKKCTSNFISNTVQVLCQKIFRQEWPLKGVLSDIPAHIRNSLSVLLDECSSVKFGRYHSNSSNVRALISKMRSIIVSDLETVHGHAKFIAPGG